MNRSQFLASVLALAVNAACSGVPPLASAHKSADSLAGAVLGALERKDRAALEALALNEVEFRDHAWPELPSSRQERNLPFSYVWGDLRQKSAHALGTTLASQGGRRYGLVGVAFSGQTTYGTYIVHREATLRVKDLAGEQTDLRVCGSMIEKDGAWKVFSYVVD